MAKRPNPNTHRWDPATQTWIDRGPTWRQIRILNVSLGIIAAVLVIWTLVGAILIVGLLERADQERQQQQHCTTLIC